MPEQNEQPPRKVLTILRVVAVIVLAVVLFVFGILILSVPELITGGAADTDGEAIRNSLYGIILIAVGLLLFFYQIMRLRRARRKHDPADSSIDGSRPGIGGAGGEAVTSANETNGRQLRHTDASTEARAKVAGELGGELVEESGRIIRIPRDTLDDRLRNVFDQGCEWLDAGELKDSAFPVALLIPSRQELLDYLSEHYPPRTIMMANHIGKGSGLPYFVNEGVHLHCAMVNRPHDVEIMLDHYAPHIPLACVLVAGNMPLDTRGTDSNQMETIRNSVIGLLCWHEERDDYILVTPR
ncbi:MAG: hypothetical protein WAN89_04080 [Lawsonella sp.]